MSNLFMDMHRRNRRRRHNRSDDFSTNSSFNTSACSDGDDYQHKLAAADENDEAADELSNILSLKLKKPKHWKWELTTSRSCTNIALPRILLYDHNGQLLIDANSQEEQVYRATEPQKPTNRSSRKRASNRAATTNLAHSIRQALQQEFDGLQIQEASPSLPSPTDSSLHTRTTSPLASSSCIDFYTNDLPDFKSERRSSSYKGVRFKDSQALDEDDEKSTANSFQVNGLPTPPPSSGTTPTTGTSSSSGPREKRRYRRPHSSGRTTPINSPSILERFSFNRGRFSSPEYAEEQEVYRPPRYFLRTSKAGTLIVQEESFSRYRRRPVRPKNASSENLTYETSSFKEPSEPKPAQFLTASSPAQPLDKVQAASLQNVSQLRRKKKTLSIRRYRSDGNILLHTQQHSSTDDEVAESLASDSQYSIDTQTPRSRRNENLKRHLKPELVTVDPGNCVFSPYGSPTER